MSQSFSAASFHDDELVGQALRIIEQNVRAGLGVDHIAERLLVSRRTLERRFLRTLGVSVGHVQRRRRLDIARELLARTDLPIKAIADSAGFRSLPYFTQQFRHEFGQTPAAFRRGAAGVYVSEHQESPRDS